LGLVASEEPLPRSRPALLLPALCIATVANSLAIAALLLTAPVAAAVVTHVATAPPEEPKPAESEDTAEPEEVEMAKVAVKIERPTASKSGSKTSKKQNTRFVVAAASPPTSTVPNSVQGAPQPSKTPVNPCSNLAALEMRAQVGKLDKPQTKCLTTLTTDRWAELSDRRKASRLLIADSWSSGEKVHWRRLVETHLRTLDARDPDLAYRFAVDLEQRNRHAEALIWSSVAIDNSTRWQGTEYRNRVYGVYKVRANAAEGMWQTAEQTHAATPSQATWYAAADTRARTTAYTVEWLEFAKRSGKDTTLASTLCLSVASDDGICDA